MSRLKMLMDSMTDDWINGTARVIRHVGQTARGNEIAMTTQEIVIRDETGDDAAAITEVTIAAFESLEISNHTEQFIIEALRSARALTLSLVAEVDGRVVGSTPSLTRRGRPSARERSSFRARSSSETMPPGTTPRRRASSWRWASLLIAVALGGTRPGRRAVRGPGPRGLWCG